MLLMVPTTGDSIMRQILHRPPPKGSVGGVLCMTQAGLVGQRAAHVRAACVQAVVGACSTGSSLWAQLHRFCSYLSCGNQEQLLVRVSW